MALLWECGQLSLAGICQSLQSLHVGNDQAFACLTRIFVPILDPRSSWIVTATWNGVDNKIRRIRMLRLRLSLSHSIAVATRRPAVVVLQKDHRDASEISRFSGDLSV